MKKFLLTLLFCVFANPIFAQTKPIIKTNLNITIDTKTTATLNSIKNSFTKHINDKLCNNKDIKIDSIKDKPFENAICGSKTIGETYDCICKTKTKFYETVKAITNFEKLTGNTNNQFEQIINFYNALNSIPNLTSELDKFLTKIKELKQQEEDDKAREEAERQEIINKLAENLAKKLKEEKDLRNDYPDIVKDLEKENKLKTHLDNGIKNYMKNPTNNEDDAKTAAKAYIEKILKQKPDLKNNQLENFFKENEEKENSETSITQHNIDAINDAKQANENKKKDKLKELQKLKKQEAELINQLGDTTVNPTTTENNFNKPDNNKKLNNALNKLLEGQNPDMHPVDKETNELKDVEKDITNTKNNIEKLKNKIKEKENKLKELDEQLKNKYEDIKKLLHKQNIEECTIFGRIDTIIRNGSPIIPGYQKLQISGAFITCNNVSSSNKTKTLNQMFEISDTKEKQQWLDCLETKINNLKINLGKINPENKGPIEEYKNTIIDKYPGTKELNCNFKCYNEANNYDAWYKANGNTLDTYLNARNGKTLEQQIKECQLNKFVCKDDNGNTLQLPSTPKPTSLEEANKLCKEAKNKNKIDKFRCEGVSNALNNAVKANTRKELNKNPNKSVDEILNSECAKAQKIAQFTCEGVSQDTLTKIKGNMETALNRNPQPTLNDILKDIGEKECKEAQTIEKFSCSGITQNKLEEIKNKMRDMFNKTPQPSIDSIKAFGQSECSDAQKQAQIDNFTCRDVGVNIDIDTTILQKIRNLMKKELEKTPQPSIDDIKQNIGKRECLKAQEEAEKARRAAELSNTKEELKNKFDDMCKVHKARAWIKRGSTQAANNSNKYTAIDTTQTKYNPLSNNLKLNGETIYGTDIVKEYTKLVNKYCKLMKQSGKTDDKLSELTKQFKKCNHTVDFSAERIIEYNIKSLAGILGVPAPNPAFTCQYAEAIENK